MVKYKKVIIHTVNPVGYDSSNSYTLELEKTEIEEYDNGIRVEEIDKVVIIPWTNIRSLTYCE